MKQYILFAGVNGAGKTTFYQTYPKLKEMPRVNVDEIVRRFGNWSSPGDVTRAGMQAVREIREYFEKGVSFNQETTLCGKSILRNINIAKKKEYQLILYYVGLDSAERAKERVAQRVANGGHGISDSDIERRYYESLQNLKIVLPLFDRVELFDNTDRFRQIAIFENGKCVDAAESIPPWCAEIVAFRPGDSST